MASEASISIFKVAARLLHETDRATSLESPCRAPVERRSRSITSVADSGYYSCDGSIHNTDVIPTPCRATRDMVHLSRDLVQFYMKQTVCINGPLFDLRKEFSPGRILDSFLTSSNVTMCDAWDLGRIVAAHTLKSIPNDRVVECCEFESNVEIYLSLVLAITLSGGESAQYLERARNLSKKRRGYLTEYVGRVQTLLSCRYTSAPDTQDTQGSISKRTRRTIKSLLSMFLKCPKNGPLSPKTLPIAAVVLADSETLGSFTVTSPAHSSLRSVHASSSRRPPLPSLWSLQIKPLTPQPGYYQNDALPVISRTPSTYFADSSPSSEGPTTPISFADRDGKLSTVTSTFSLFLTTSQQRPRSSTTNLSPVLAKVENDSIFRRRAECSTCSKVGLDYPKCPRCGQMWCCRECRLQGGKKHVCPVHS